MPENIYYWRTRFHDDKNWGAWSDGSDYFKIGGLKDIIENGTCRPFEPPSESIVNFSKTRRIQIKPEQKHESLP